MTEILEYLQSALPFAAFDSRGQADGSLVICGACTPVCGVDALVGQFDRVLQALGHVDTRNNIAPHAKGLLGHEKHHFEAYGGLAQITLAVEVSLFQTVDNLLTGFRTLGSLTPHEDAVIALAPEDGLYGPSGTDIRRALKGDFPWASQELLARDYRFQDQMTGVNLVGSIDVMVGLGKLPIIVLPSPNAYNQTYFYL